MGRMLIFVGMLLLSFGLIFHFGERVGLGYLPGDLHLKRDGYTVHIPIVTCMLLSLGCSFLYWIIQFFRR